MWGSVKGQGGSGLVTTALTVWLGFSLGKKEGRELQAL